MIEVVRAGFAPDYVEYDRGWELQRRSHDAILAGRSTGILILCEHTSVYTAGTSARAEEFPTDGTPVVRVSRGGRVTWHGPGQLIGYPILRPGPLSGGTGVDVVGHVRRLEGVLIATAAEFGVTGFRVPGRSGVWVEGTSGAVNKLAAIGIRVEAGVTLHGFALNCGSDLGPFEHIVPCGIRDAGVTSLSLETGRALDPRAVATVLEENFDRWYHEDLVLTATAELA